MDRGLDGYAFCENGHTSQIYDLLCPESEQAKIRTIKDTIERLKIELTFVENKYDAMVASMGVK
jgi:hypothetical protein